MHIPESFHEQLRAEFGGQLRARWSRAKGRVVIERKSARGREDSLLPPMPSLSRVGDPAKRRYLALRFEERLEQARTGFYPVMEIAPGDRVACPWCDRSTHIPVCQWHTARCEWCHKEFNAMYWPLGAGVLERLRWSDPDRGGFERAVADTDAAGEAKERQARRALSNETEAIWKDAFPHVFEIPSVGWTPQTGKMEGTDGRHHTP